VTRGAAVRGALVAVAIAIAHPASAQVTVGSGVDYLGYSFDDGLGAEAAQLMLVPVALRVPAGSRLSFDLYSAWAEGRVEQTGAVMTLSGPVDTHVRASLQATPWAVVSVGVNVPTGDPSHTGEEAVVAAVLSTDLLGFREATWGTGFAVTSSVATAAAAGGFGLGVAAAYAARGSFEPSADDDLSYQPGNEIRIRGGLDRNFGNSTLTAGATFITYADDRADGLNLFRAGNRVRLDGAYAFRAGAGVWTFYAADLMRSNGDLFVDIVDGGGAIVGQSTVQTAKQNLFIGGVMGTMALGGGYVFRPHIDFKLQSREEPDGTDAGSGWIFAAGGDIPIRIRGWEAFPKGRIYLGSVRGVGGDGVGLVGVELKGTIRTTF
jgi:hypothetical protein